MVLTKIGGGVRVNGASLSFEKGSVAPEQAARSPAQKKSTRAAPVLAAGLIPFPAV